MVYVQKNAVLLPMQSGTWPGFSPFCAKKKFVTTVKTAFSKLFWFFPWAAPVEEAFFSTSHVIPHIRALVPCPGLTSEVCIVASTSMPLTPTEILNLVFL